MSARRTPPQRSLKGRALQLLAQREHSRAEMRRKLLVHARASARVAAAALAAEAGAAGAVALPEGATTASAATGPTVVSSDNSSDPRAEVEATLDWLEANRYLSQERFVESRVHARAGRFGNLRIRQELKQHAVTLAPEAAQALQASEFDRARDVWARKFPTAGTTPAERARQARFLAGRGFTPEVIHRLLRMAHSMPDDDIPAPARDD